MKKPGMLTTVVGAGLAAVAGYYILSDSDEARTRRRQMRSWMLRFRADVMDKLDDAKDMTAEAYGRTVDVIKEKYEDMKEVDKAELEDLSDELKSHWSAIKTEMSGAGSAVKTAGKNILRNSKRKTQTKE